jgi:hypothetical protein
VIHFEFKLVQGDKHGPSFSLLQADNPLFPETFVKEAVFSPFYVFGALSKIRWA